MKNGKTVRCKSKSYCLVIPQEVLQDCQIVGNPLKLYIPSNVSNNIMASEKDRWYGKNYEDKINNQNGKPAANLLYKSIVQFGGSMSVGGLNPLKIEPAHLRKFVESRSLLKTINEEIKGYALMVALFSVIRPKNLKKVFYVVYGNISKITKNKKITKYKNTKIFFFCNYNLSGFSGFSGLSLPESVSIFEKSS